MDLNELPGEVAAQTPSPPLSSDNTLGKSPGTPAGGAAPAVVPPSAVGRGSSGPFTLDLNMVKMLMAAVNEQLGVDLGDAQMDETAVVAESPELSQSIRQAGGVPPEQNRDAPQKGEYSHVRLICDACGHIVAAVAAAVLKAIIEAGEEAARVGAPPSRMVAPLRKKRGGILGFKELAAKANLSPWHFHRVFRSVTGVTPKAYGEALWDHLMRENGFDVEESSVVTTSANGGTSGGSETGAMFGVGSSSAASSDASSSSPNSAQKPQVGFPLIPSPPMLYTQKDDTGTNNVTPTGTGSDTLQRTASMGASGSDRSGRVRKARSLSRSGRSRSRPRSGAPARINTGVSSQMYNQRSQSHVRGPRVFGGTVSNTDLPPTRLQSRYANRHRHHASISGGEFGSNFLDLGPSPTSALDIPVFDPPDLNSLTLTMPPLPSTLTPPQPPSASSVAPSPSVLDPPQPNPEPNASGGAPFTNLNPQWLANPAQAVPQQQDQPLVAPSLSFNNNVSFPNSVPSNTGALSGMLAAEESPPMATPPPADALGSLPQQFYMSSKEKIDFDNDFGPAPDLSNDDDIGIFNLGSLDQDNRLLADPVSNGGNEALW